MAFVTDPIGIKGEEEAAKMLEKKGYKVIEHNWRLGHWEIDLIAENKEEVVFVEVKARTTMYGDIRPEEYVDEAKKKRMITSGNAFMRHCRSPKSLRFDIIGIVVDPQTMDVVYKSHLEDAFQPSARAITHGSHSPSWQWSHKNIRRKK
jgi:putative endonuclease